MVYITEMVPVRSMIIAAEKFKKEVSI